MAGTTAKKGAARELITESERSGPLWSPRLKYTGKKFCKHENHFINTRASAAMIAIQSAFMLITAWVIYMFYARLRDIAEELMNLRVAYEFANPPKSGASRPVTPPEAAANPFEQGGDAHYQPK